ncbi:MAG: glycine cleavage system protein GcvH [Chlamydiota bacterium]|nr:glycine cleavage system protein GcvH [Chlamydiota bacterium]
MKYTPSHEWFSLEGDSGKVGISKEAKREIGEVVHIELPKIGDRVIQGDPLAVIESTKAAIDLHAPCSGEVIATHEEVINHLDWFNEDPEGKGWLYVLRPSDLDEWRSLLSKEAYYALISS